MIDTLILAADLPPTTATNGMRLAQRAHPDNGHIVIFWPELCELWECSQGTARRHLGLLHKAGIVHYSSNGDGCAYITFRAMSRVGARETAKNLTENARGRATEPVAPEPADAAVSKNSTENARGRAKNENARAENVDESAFSYTHAGAQLVGWLVGSTDPTDPEPTNQPAAVTGPPTTEAATAAAGLLRIRMTGDKARAIAASVPLEVIREAVGAWWCNRRAAGGQFDDSPGIVVAWLREWHRTRATPWPEPPASWGDSDLYRLMCTPAELDAQAAQEAAAELDDEPEPVRLPQPAPQPKPKPEPGTPEAFWSQLQADFAMHQAAGGPESVLASSWVVEYAEGVFTIGIADAFRLDWVEKKLRNQVKRRLAVIMGLATVDVRFVVGQPAEGGTSETIYT